MRVAGGGVSSSRNAQVSETLVTFAYIIDVKLPRTLTRRARVYSKLSSNSGYVYNETLAFRYVCMSDSGRTSLFS